MRKAKKSYFLIRSLCFSLAQRTFLRIWDGADDVVAEARIIRNLSMGWTLGNKECPSSHYAICVCFFAMKMERGG